MNLAVWLGAAIAAIALVRWMRRRWVIVTVRGASMMPTLGDGQRLLARRARGDRGQLRVGDIVVFLAPERAWLHPLPGSHYLVKRVAALGGALAESAEAAGDSVVVLGDNPHASQDSRHFGPVNRRSIIGIARRARRSGASDLP